MKEYTFFSYNSHEALHLSDQEKQMITSLVNTIELEYSQNLDAYSQELIVSHLELLLNYCKTLLWQAISDPDPCQCRCGRPL